MPNSSVFVCPEVDVNWKTTKKSHTEQKIMDNNWNCQTIEGKSQLTLLKYTLTKQCVHVLFSEWLLIIITIILIVKIKFRSSVTFILIIFYQLQYEFHYDRKTNIFFGLWVPNSKIRNHTNKRSKHYAKLHKFTTITADVVLYLACE